MKNLEWLEDLVSAKLPNCHKFACRIEHSRERNVRVGLGANPLSVREEAGPFGGHDGRREVRHALVGWQERLPEQTRRGQGYVFAAHVEAGKP